MAPRTTSGSASTVPSGGLPTWVVGERSSTHPASLRPGPRKAMKATKAKAAQPAGNARGRRPKSASASAPTGSSAGRYAAPAPTTRPRCSVVPIDHAVAAASTTAVSYTHLRAHETVLDLVCRLLLEK